jgi:hypothetical protein
MGWFPNWSGQTVVIVASGPSATSVDLTPARGVARFIAINNSWKLAPWADMLYACDLAWWDHAEGCPEFEGMKVSSDPYAVRKYLDINHILCRRLTDRINMTDNLEIGWGGNSGFGAINIAAKAKVSRIVLVGFDMRVDLGTHWHGRHPGEMHNPTVNNIGRYRRAIDAAAEPLREAGIEVLNCSPVSRLTAYRKVDFQEAISPLLQAA